VLAALVAPPGAAQERPISAGALRSGIEYAGADVRGMQVDDAANPGMLWVARGEQLWDEAAGTSSCRSCHGDARTSMRGVAARHPVADPRSGQAITLAAKVASCRSERQRITVSSPEDDDVVALASFVAFQSRGMGISVAIDGAARPSFERGRAFYTRRQGQMNLACTQCHDDNHGKRLYSERLSQGHPSAFPAYRLEWQGVGTLDRRVRACLFGIRAQVPSPGSRELADVELYLAWRAQGLPMEAPGVRR
jgi:sulfur-oxidizing protein SoxA